MKTDQFAHLVEAYMIPSNIISVLNVHKGKMFLHDL